MLPVNKLYRKECKSSETVTCPACQQQVTQVRYAYQQEGYQSVILKCEVCSFMFARPAFIEDLTERQMDSVDDAEMFGSPMLKSIYVKWFLKKELREVRKMVRVKTPALLDIGCGTGWTTFFWKENGFNVHGLEPSVIRSQIAREKYGLEVFNDYLENYDPEKRYDVILMRHSLEHFEKPSNVLTKINALLNDDGVVLLVVPNIDCLGRYLFGTDWQWVLPWHCNFFNPKSTKLILQSAGFADISLYQTPSPLYLFDSLGRKLNTRLFDDLRKKSRAALLLASAPFALLGTVLGMGDNITVVARKTHSLDNLTP
jgi:2-polyprenyl-3-methyl-5-hydroxy-6-metoxy-1,4-benzoquinol methylase